MTRRVLLVAAMTAIASAGGEWDNLKLVTHRRSYGFAMRDGTCLVGKIGSITADSLQISEASPATLKRPDILRVSDGDHAYNVVYSGRSSWSDVIAIPPSAKSYLRVITKDAKRYEGSAQQVAEAEMTLSKAGKLIDIVKSEVARVYYVRLKPLSDSARYSDEERFPLNPELWPYYWNIGVHMPVLLYDSSTPEDNSRIVCAVH